MNSAWWAPILTPSQAYGCTDLALEGHNPNHPECPYFHEGIDVPLPCGTSIHAGREVTVTACDPPGYGPPGGTAAICLWDKSTNRDVWMYHMQAPYAVPVGAIVKAGQLIGYSGTRGYSTGCHIHFEVRPHGAPYRSSIDPTPYLEDDMDNRQYYNILEAVYGYRLNDDGSPTLDAKGGKILTPFAASVAAQFAAIPPPLAPVIDTTALARAIAAQLPAQSKPPAPPQAVWDWLAAMRKFLGWT